MARPAGPWALFIDAATFLLNVPASADPARNVFCFHTMYSTCIVWNQDERGTYEMGRQEGLRIRGEALEALEKSTRMLEVAFNLLTQGNYAEADRVRYEARTQRTISTLLMARAHNLEMNNRPSATG